VEYELLFFTSVANEDRVGEIKKDLAEIIESLGGKLSGEFSDIGKRKLAYPIKRNTHAFFSFVRFSLDEKDRQNIPEITKRVSLSGKIIRHIVVRADEIGKPLGAPQIKPEKAAPAKRPRRPEPQPAAKPEVSPAAKPKAALSELDEKLTEILEETPE